MHSFDAVALHANVLILGEILRLQKRTEPRQKTWLLNGLKILELIEFIFVNIHGCLHPKLVRKILHELVGFQKVLVIGETDRFFQVDIQLEWKFMSFVYFVQDVYLLLIFRISLIIIGYNGSKRTTRKGESTDTYDLDESAEDHLKIVVGTDISIAYCGDSCCSPVE